MIKNNKEIILVSFFIAALANGSATANDAGAGSSVGYPTPGDIGPIVAARLEMRILSLDNPDNELFFPALQINLSSEGGGHIGPQEVSGKRTANWGGYFDEYVDPAFRYAPFFTPEPAVRDENTFGDRAVFNPDPGVSLSVQHFDPGTYTQANNLGPEGFDWEVGRNYELSVYRGGQQQGWWSWHGFINNMDSGESKYMGALYGRSDRIGVVAAWVETGVKGNAPLAYEVIMSNMTLSDEAGNRRVVKPDYGSASGAPNSSLYAPSQASFESAGTVHHINNRSVPGDAYLRATPNNTQFNTDPNAQPPNPAPGAVSGGFSGQLSAVHSGKCLTVANGNLAQLDCQGTATQQWTATPISGGVLELRHANGECADVFGAKRANQSNVVSYACNRGGAQQWIATQVSNGVYEFRNVNSNRCLDVFGAYQANNANVSIWDCNGGQAQQWRLN